MKNNIIRIHPRKQKRLLIGIFAFFIILLIRFIYLHKFPFWVFVFYPFIFLGQYLYNKHWGYIRFDNASNFITIPNDGKLKFDEINSFRETKSDIRFYTKRGMKYIEKGNVHPKDLTKLIAFLNTKIA